MKIIVLGMHRSGTSLACGLLNQCGIYFGEEKDFIQTNEENPKGFWERKDVRKLNDMLLHQMGCDWSEISNLQKVEIPENVIKNFNFDSREIIKKLKQGCTTGVIGLKEPRLCLLMPIWQHMFDENDFFLLVHRDPEEIAISLKNRNGIPPLVSNYLTEKYLGQAIHAIKDRNYLVVSYKELIQMPVQSIQNIIEAINATGQKLLIPDDKKLSKYSTPSLYRSRSTGQDWEINDTLQHFYNCLNKGELPCIPLTGTPIPEQVLSYQHSKRFDEYRKLNNSLEHNKKRIKTLEDNAVSNRAAIGQFEDDLATVRNQFLSEHQMSFIAQSRQKQLELQIQRQNLAISETSEQIVNTQSLVTDSNLRLEAMRRDTHALLNISDKLISRLQLLFSSRSWKISRRLISFMLRPLQLGSGQTVLNEINLSIEEFKNWVSTTSSCVEPDPIECLQEPMKSAGADKRPDPHLLDDKNHTVKMGLVVTEASDSTSAGDYFTARELATALTDAYNWECVYLSENSNSTDWYDVNDLDILLVLLDKYDISKIYGQTKPIIKVAWARNWVDQWTFRSWFHSFDLVLCTSEIARKYIFEQTGKFAQIFKIAANTKRFHPTSETNSHLQSDYCFTGNYWGAPRQIENLDPSKLPYKFILFGTGWDQHEQFANYCRGSLPYDKLPVAYANTKILIDDANHVTKPWASVNSRVFDALATGTLVITNGIAGATETFGDVLPTYSNTQDLERKLQYFLEHPNARRELAGKLQEITVRNHSYTNRASQFHETLRLELNAKTRIAIKLSIQQADEAIYMGDFYFGKGLAKALRKLGHSVRLDFIPDWYSTPSNPDDVVIAIRGHSHYIPDDSVLNLLWMITYPTEVQIDECEAYDNIFVASECYAEHLSKLVKTKVAPLLQCTDPEIFKIKEDHNKSRNVVFVGNSNGENRPILRDAIACDLRPLVVGKGWKDHINESLIAGEFIENGLLPEFYATSGAVLCSHQKGTTELGFIPSQLFDAVACGAVPVSKNIAGIKEIFGEAVYVYSGGCDELKLTVQHALAELPSIQQQRNILAQKIAKEHSFENRAKFIDSIISRDL